MLDITLPALILLGTLSAISLVVCTVAAIRLGKRQPVIEAPASPPAEPHWISVMLVLMWVFMLLSSFLMTPTAEGKAPRIVDVQFLCMMSAMMFLGLGAPLLVLGRENLKGLGFHGQDEWRQIRIGALSFFASVLPVMAAYSTTLPWRTSENQHGLLQLLNEDASITTLLWIVLAAVILAPLLEELMYRVILQTWLQRIAPPREALIAVAVLFAAVHRLPDAIPLLPLALVLGYVYQQSRSFLAVVLTHMLFNATNLTLALM